MLPEVPEVEAWLQHTEYTLASDQMCHPRLQSVCPAIQSMQQRYYNMH